MWKSYLAAALRNLSRNRLHAAITTLSLTIGFTAAILAALYWQYQTHYDGFWPNANRLYLAAQWDYAEDGRPTTSDAANPALAGLALATIPQIEKAARMGQMHAQLAHGSVEAVEDHVMWADASLFSVLRPRAVDGDPRSALSQANTIVLTRSLARKYFGEEGAVGKTISVRDLDAEEAPPVAMQVTAVIEDLPDNSHIDAQGFVSGLTAGSALLDPSASAALDSPKGRAYTYLLARPGARPEQIAAGLDEIARRHFAIGPGREKRSAFKLLDLPRVFLKPDGYGRFKGGTSSMSGMKGGKRDAMIGGAILGGLILAVASINFITLMTARGAGRAVEVGVRKAAGARRRDLVLQFIGEALLYAVLALVLALAAAELMLPIVNGFAGVELGLNYLADAPLIGAFLAGALLVGTLAGVYPALVLSSFRPASALKGGKVRTGSVKLRHALVAAQFVPLILLGLLSLTLQRHFEQSLQTSMAMLDPATLIIDEPCTPALKAQIGAVAGIGTVVCTAAGGWYSSSAVTAMTIGWNGGRAKAADGEVFGLMGGGVDHGALQFHGMKVLAGRLFDPARTDQNSVVINRSTAVRLGYPRASDAVGKTLDWNDDEAWRPLQIIGVIEDRGGIADFEHTAYRLDTKANNMSLGAKVPEQGRAEILARLDEAWAAMGKTRPMKRYFQADDIGERFAEDFRVVNLLGACIGIGVFIAAAGLFGLAAFLAEQKTKEIGVRKALGATRAQVLRRLVVQFAWPVILANLIGGALFIAAGLFQLSMPARERMPLEAQVFAPVIAGSLLVAFLAVFAHAWRVSSERPVKALRYE